MLDLASLNPGVIWIGIALCISQSALFSGLNLAVFGSSRLSLEVGSKTGNQAAKKLLKFREDSNHILTTIVWGNVAANVLLTLLSDSVLAGLAAFLFSTFAITLIGEIMPQAYFSRNALKMVESLSPILRFYQILFYPIAKPCANLLDMWLGKEGINYYREKALREVIRRHIEAEGSDLDIVEGKGAINFLELDDLPVATMGEPVHPASVIALEFDGDHPQFPHNQQFLKAVGASGKKWVILVDSKDCPKLVLNADAFLRSATEALPRDALSFCHRPLLVESVTTCLGAVLPKFQVDAVDSCDEVIDNDLILVWCENRRIITGADILGRLLRGISRRVALPSISVEDLADSRPSQNPNRPL